MWGVEEEPNELRPMEVAPGAAFLVSDACQEGGWILRASNGHFQGTKVLEASGVNYPRDINAVTATTIDEIASRWHKIAIATVEARAS